MDNNSFWKIHCFTFFPYKSIRDQIWPFHKIGQGQLRVIIWTNLVVLEHPMLHTNFQGHQSFGSREEDFLRFLPYMGMAAILVIWPGSFGQNFRSPIPWRLHMKFNFDWPSSFWGEMFKECGRRMDRRRKTEGYLSNYLTSEPSAQVS